MEEKLSLWDRVAQTDPKYTKSFKRAGGFSGTAVNPTYAIKKMTEIFGPCGDGWGLGKPEFQIYDAGEQGVLVYCVVNLWYMNGGKRCDTFGVGGDTVVSKTKYGLNADDEAFKKANTDAITNAMKTIGMSADVHLGMYDDSKYVNEAKNKFDEKKSTAEQTTPKQVNPLKLLADKIGQQLRASQTIEVLNYVWKGFGDDLAKIKEASPNAAYPALEKIYQDMAVKLVESPIETDNIPY